MAFSTLQDLFFKYSLNNFLHAKVEECIRLIFNWSNMTNSQEALNLTTTIRVKTPPTVEMVEPSQDLGDQELLVKDEDASDHNDEKAATEAVAVAAADDDDDEQPPVGKAETEEESQQPEVSSETQPSPPEVTSAAENTPSNDSSASVSGDDGAKENEASAQAVVPVADEVAVQKDEDDLYDNPLLIDVSSFTNFFRYFKFRTIDRFFF